MFALPSFVVASAIALVHMCNASPAPISRGIVKAPSATWYHEASHPVHELFTRAPSVHEIGSSEWRAQFPAAVPDSSQLPKPWVDALNAAVAAKKIPDIPLSRSQGAGTQPVYPNGLDSGSPEICSASGKCRNLELGDIWDAPEGYFATSFDDGPLPSSIRLLEFLDSEDIVTTHFLIGVTILANPKEFKAVIDSGGDLAVHTYTHPQMTTLSNLDVVAQIGWTMEIIYQSTGKVPRFWRPPTGDADNRVRAIAQEVFGLKTVMWNRESDDWKINALPPIITREQLRNTLTGFAAGPKTAAGPIVLEHETSDATVQGFIDAYPTIKSSGWNIVPISGLPGAGSAYREAGPDDSVAYNGEAEDKDNDADDHDDDDDDDNSDSNDNSSTATSASQTGTSGGSRSEPTQSPGNGVSSTQSTPIALILLSVTTIMTLY